MLAKNAQWLRNNEETLEYHISGIKTFTMSRSQVLLNGQALAFLK